MDSKTITVKNGDGDTLAVELVLDVGIKEYLHTFRTILFWLEFDIETINEYLGEEK